MAGQVADIFVSWKVAAAVAALLLYILIFNAATGCAADAAAAA